jgi:hypothetical protein
MSEILWTDTDNGPLVFVLLALLGSAVAMATGRNRHSMDDAYG